MDMNTKLKKNQYVTQKELCQILGICKSTAYKLQRKGIISFEYENTCKGRRQKICTNEIQNYVIRKEYYLEEGSEFTEMLAFYFQEQLSHYSSLLSVADIIRFTGYSKSAINNWVLQGHLPSLNYQGKRIKSFKQGKGSLITKEMMVFFLSRTYYRRIVRKTQIHKNQENDCIQLYVTFRSLKGAQKNG